jgi:L-arabinose transport system permease protein
MTNQMNKSAARPHLMAAWDKMGMLAVFVVMFIVLSVCVPNFFNLVNMKGLALSVATVGIIACTMMFCLAAGDFDLSIGSVVAMSGVLSAIVVNKTGSVLLGIGSGVLAGGIVGLVNGFVIARVGINALIATLATMLMVRGAGYIICDGKSVGVSNENFFLLGITSFPHITLGNSQFTGIPTPVWIMILSFVIFGILLHKTIFGRYALAIGGNKQSARFAGINVVKTKIAIFTLQGLVAGFAGVILASRFSSGQPKTSEGLELQVISACVLGGVSLTGGVATMTGVIVGVFIMGTVQNAMDLKNIDSFYQYVVRGGILLAAVLFDRMKQTVRR